MLFQNVNAVLPDRVECTSVRVDQQKIIAIGPELEALPGEEVLSCAEKYLLPGMIDTHTHGAVGGSYFIPGEDLNRMTAFEASVGITTVAASLTGRSMEDMNQCIDSILQCMKDGTSGARIGGIHFEGPFLNVKRKGGMVAEYLLPPTIDMFDRFYEKSEGTMKIMTIAPELPGALEVIQHGAAKGVAMSAGHSDATYEEMKKAIDAGITRLTHSFNAARPLHHREPGVLGAALTDPRVTCEVICDFTHLHPCTVQLIYLAKGSHNFCAISDSEFCAGLPEGSASYGGRTYDIHDGVAWLPDGTICGSAGHLGLALLHLLSLHVPLTEIAEMTALNGARALGIDHRTGSIETGKEADLVLLSSDYQLLSTYVLGKCVYHRS